MSEINKVVSRRSAAGLLGLLGVSAVGAAVAPSRLDLGTQPVVAAAGEHAHGGLLLEEATPKRQAEDGPSADEMEAMHEEGVKAFPATTAGLGGQPLPFTLDGEVKVFALVCQVVEWEFMPGKTVEAWTYNGVTPGPEIRVTEGDT